MKHFQIQQALLKKGLLSAACFVIIFFLAGCRKHYENHTPKVTTLVTGINGPMGLELIPGGHLLVAETGNANNDGKIKLLRREQGTFKMYDAVVNLASIKNALSGEVEGPAHLLLDGKTLYVLAGDYLYSIDFKNFKAGGEPIDGSKLSYEDIGSWVRSQNIVTPNDSHPYNLVKGPDGKLYITDAGANALIKRNSAGNYSILATFPDLKNPTSVGPPVMQSVPTGILFDGKNFLVTTLTGFPFPAGQAVVYKVSLSGKVAIHTDGYSTLTDIAPGNAFGNVLLSFGAFGQEGFVPNTGSLFFAHDRYTQEIASGLNMPSAVRQADDHTWFVSALGDGAVLQISYK